MRIWKELREIFAEDIHPVELVNPLRARARSRQFFLLVREVWRSIRRDNAFQMAAALSFNTLLALVPLMAISLAFLAIIDSTGEGAEAGEYAQRFQTFISNQVPNAAAYVFRAMDQFVKNAGAIAGVGVCFLFWTAITLLGAIEKSFNVIWQVREKRTFMARLTAFLATLIVVPILMSASVYLTTQLASVTQAAVAKVSGVRLPTTDVKTSITAEGRAAREKTNVSLDADSQGRGAATADSPVASENLSAIKARAIPDRKPSPKPPLLSQPYPVRVVLFVTPIFISCLALAALYYLLPFTPVRVRAAIIGGGIAGCMVEIAKHLFRYYAENMTANYLQIYGPMLSLPLFLLWVWMVWVIVLIGAEIAFVTQNFRDLAAKADLERRGIRSRIYLAVRIVLAVSEAFHLGRQPAGLVDRITETLHTPPYILREILSVLVAKNILRRVVGAEDGYVPARDIGVLSVGEVQRAVTADRLDVPEVSGDPLRDYLAGKFSGIERDAAAVLDGMTFLDLVAREKAFAAAGMEFSDTESLAP